MIKWMFQDMNRMHFAPRSPSSNFFLFFLCEKLEFRLDDDLKGKERRFCGKRKLQKNKRTKEQKQETRNKKQETLEVFLQRLTAF